METSINPVPYDFDALVQSLIAEVAARKSMQPDLMVMNWILERLIVEKSEQPRVNGKFARKSDGVGGDTVEPVSIKNKGGRPPGKVSNECKPRQTASANKQSISRSMNLSDAALQAEIDMINYRQRVHKNKAGSQRLKQLVQEKFDRELKRLSPWTESQPVTEKRGVDLNKPVIEPARDIFLKANKTNYPDADRQHLIDKRLYPFHDRLFVDGVNAWRPVELTDDELLAAHKQLAERVRMYDKNGYAPKSEREQFKACTQECQRRGIMTRHS